MGGDNGGKLGKVVRDIKDTWTKPKGGRIEGEKWEQMGKGGVVGGKWRQLCLNYNKKIKIYQKSKQCKVSIIKS